MESSDFLVKDFGEFVDSVDVFVGLLVVPELKLSQSLVAERAAHDERGVTSGTAQVEETA